MRSQGYSSSNTRKRDNGRSTNTLLPKRSVDDVFSSSRFFPAPASHKPTPIQRDLTFGAPVARGTIPDYSFRPPEPPQKPSESSSRQPTQSIRWMKGELLGRGSHGRVYLGFNVTTGELLAVKQVEIPTTADDRRKADTEPLKNFVRMLREERETLKDLYHPNIVQYLGFEENLETVNIFLEYVSGGTIAGSLQEHGPFKEEVTKSFTRQILEGLSYLHSKGIIHRDLKSDNILISDSGICKISDFGISKRLEKPRTHTFKGTFNWMAPEVLSNGNAGYDFKADIWSIGCIVLEMWTAKRPWHNETFVKVMMELTERRIPPLPAGITLSTLADNFRKKCFELNPAKRPKADQLLRHSYLILKSGWTFPGMSDIGSFSPLAEAEEMAEILSRTLEFGSSDSLDRSSSPALTMNSMVDTESNPTLNPPRSISPPLVYIAPPPPRKVSSTQDAHTWPSRTRDRSGSVASVSSGSHESGQAKRMLAIHNPETIPDLTTLKKRDLRKPPKPPVFVYHPPPLPEVTTSTPYSNQLGPQTKYSVGPPSQRQQKTNARSDTIPPPATSLSLPTTVHRMGPANYRDIMSQQWTTNSIQTNSVDSGSYATTTTADSGSGSGWQVPPPNVMSRSRSEPYGMLSGVSASNVRRLPPTPMQQTQLAESSPIPKHSPVFADNARPNSRDVLERMKVYFPNHDLDEPVVAGQMDSTFASHPQMNTDTMLARHFTMKSIKTIAEEQIRRDRSASDPNRRRQTMLWDSHLEEIKAPRQF